MASLSCRVLRTVHRHRYRVACLHEHRSGPRELAHQAFAGSQVADNAAGRNAFEDILAVPRD